jgi:hypothetical protein
MFLMPNLANVTKEEKDQLSNLLRQTIQWLKERGK